MEHMACWNIKRADGKSESWMYHKGDGTFADIGGSLRVLNVNDFDDYCELWGARGPVDSIEESKKTKYLFSPEDLNQIRPTLSRHP